MHFNFSCNATESGFEMDEIIIYFQIAGGFEADVKDDFTVLYKLCRYAGTGINHHNNIGCVAIVGAPLIKSAQQVRFGGSFRHQTVTLKKAWIKEHTLCLPETVADPKVRQRH